ncbi:uncharacterized protein MONBRDRAFT_23375 [Monosiga brevicollis MX1]|uniref:JmjC domain-containing protein n=1 Tax=Monosiga brevicollis TaxID=81824 RepID=A9UT76_MONBE|nr:uncharacterized protein MONBRDRAFT_23375 [Monosiga brevicollis MX1]EDQ91198.1 predicted protein [Monosiga brevicollis MX1]|eukprot:XP_001743620.1 hypothetical protein [Monosiga brevicollis MX1]
MLRAAEPARERGCSWLAVVVLSMMIGVGICGADSAPDPCIMGLATVGRVAPKLLVRVVEQLEQQRTAHHLAGLAWLQHGSPVRTIASSLQWEAIYVAAVEDEVAASPASEATVASLLKLLDDIFTASRLTPCARWVVLVGGWDPKEAPPSPDIFANVIQDWPNTLQLVLSLPGADFVSQRVGFAEADRAFPDGSYFRRAPTLKALISMGDIASNSLQAHILAKGGYLRTVSAQQLLELHGRGYFVNEQPYAPASRPPTAAAALHVDVMSAPDAHCAPIAADPMTNYLDARGSEEPFMETLVAAAKPVLVHSKVIQGWAGRQRWTNLSTLLDDFGLDVFEDVKVSRHGRYSDADMAAPLAQSEETDVHWEAPFEVKDLTRADIEANVAAAQASAAGGSPAAKLSYFSSVSEGLLRHMRPDFCAYLTSDDWMYRRQFVWFSTAGATTHFHFDQDYNLFVQMSGRKRFYFYPTSAAPDMRMFPRVHPLWHKSQLDPCSSGSNSGGMALNDRRAWVLEVGPGDAVYIPPYVWHRVETLTPHSLSLSTLSHDDELRENMESIYTMDHKFDRLRDGRGRMFALRLYVDMLLNEMVGYQRTRSFLDELLRERYAGHEALFVDQPELCAAQQVGGLPTAQHVYGDCLTDMRLTTALFETITDRAVRDLLLKDYIEELAAQVVGARQVWSFFYYCFRDQEYYITDMASEEHSMWDYASPDDLPSESAT